MTGSLPEPREWKVVNGQVERLRTCSDVLASEGYVLPVAELRRVANLVESMNEGEVEKS
jgi:hypothetical protein